MLSALLSLATDNAKELCLAKLNANSRMAGMYIYGLSMGISYKELGELLMSEVGDTVNGLLKGSIISDKLNLNTIDKVISYLENPYSVISKYASSEKLFTYSDKNGKLSRSSDSVMGKINRALITELENMVSY
jgi:hypothetical protein